MLGLAVIPRTALLKGHSTSWREARTSGWLAGLDGKKFLIARVIARSSPFSELDWCAKAANYDTFTLRVTRSGSVIRCLACNTDPNRDRDIKRGHRILYRVSKFVVPQLSSIFCSSSSSQTLITMKTSLLSLIALSASGVWAHGEDAAKEMGPVAFMWPTDRKWGEKYDNNAPCGSNTGPVNRTDFPLSRFRCPRFSPSSNSLPVNGKLALVVQDESWNVQVSVSHKNSMNLLSIS